MTMPLYFYDSLSKTKKVFTPITSHSVKLYVCGITPYDYAHLGHGRCYVSFDLLYRFLTLLNYNVTYVRNYTDIDDKIINKALQATPQAHYSDISKKFIASFKQDMQALNCLPPTHEPTVTESIESIISFVEGLITQKHAYVINNDVYFDISTFPSYGKLSGKNLEQLQAGARIDVDTRKKNPGDFALWKGTPNKTFWHSPWGFGRPGWHIECSAMAHSILGETIDIHGGGQDLQFPHHENEIAQTESLTKKTFANTWLHNAFVNINKEKMSKSLGNFVTLQGLFKDIDPMVLRYYYLQHHYRTPLDFSAEELTSVTTAYKKLTALAQLLTEPITITNISIAEIIENNLGQKLIAALCDDLNTPKFLGIIFEHFSEIKLNSNYLRIIVFLLQSALGLTLNPLANTEPVITPEIEDLLKQRNIARQEKNWALADTLREKLKQLGYTPQDKK